MIKIIYWFIVTVILFTFTNGRQFRYDYKYYHEAEGWLKLHLVPANWHEARLRCKLEGGNLASPLDAHLAGAMRTMYVINNISACGIYTGIHATFSRGDFHSVEGIPLDRIPVRWASDEPDNRDNTESCLIMDQKGLLSDVNCSDTFPYMCYKRIDNMEVNSCGTIDSEYAMETKTGSCYKFHSMARTWSRAYMTCAAEGAYLTIVNSEVESRILGDIFTKNPPNTLTSRHKNYAFVGFHDWGEHGLWWTVQGDTLQEAGFSTWAAGQPDNATTGEFCGSIHRNGLFNDIGCEEKVSFICEKAGDSLLANDD